MAATIYLTSSRGGAAVALAGTIVFLTLTARRGQALGAIACAAAGSAAVVGILLGRDELVDGPLQSAAAADQGEGAALLIALFCLLAGGAFALASRFIPRPSFTLSPNARRGIAVAAVLAALIGVAAIDPVDRFETFKKSPDEFANIETDFTRAHLLSGSGSGRWQFWSAAVDQFQERPLAGDGAGSFEAYWARNGSLYRFIRDAHSLYLETLAELGLIGLLLLASALGLALAVALSRLRGAARDEDRVMVASLAALLVAWGIGAGIDWMWELTAVTLVAMVAIGLLTGPATARAPALGRDGDQSLDGVSSTAAEGRRNFALRAGVVVVAVFVIVTQAVPLLAQTKVRDSQAAAARGDLPEALDAARDAQAIQPWASSPQLQQALVEEQAGSLEAARGSILEAIDDDRSDWRLWLVRARLETKLGEVRHAGRSLRRAERLNPRSPLFADERR
jgi:tetratricopeptide (TPR) repeat protein